MKPSEIVWIVAACILGIAVAVAMVIGWIRAIRDAMEGDREAIPLAVVGSVAVLAAAGCVLDACGL